MAHLPPTLAVAVRTMVGAEMRLMQVCVMTCVAGTGAGTRVGGEEGAVEGCLMTVWPLLLLLQSHTC